MSEIDVLKAQFDSLRDTIKDLKDMVVETTQKVEYLGNVLARIEERDRHIQAQLDSQSECIDKADGRIADIEKEPGDKYKSLTGAVAMFFIGAILTIVANKVGLI